MTDSAEPAFPLVFSEFAPTHVGLTKREYFAGLAMQGILSSPEGWENSPESMARCAVAGADALLAELGRGR